MKRCGSCMRWDDGGKPTSNFGICECSGKEVSRGFYCGRYWSVFWLCCGGVRKRVERFRVFEELRYKTS